MYLAICIAFINPINLTECFFQHLLSLCSVRDRVGLVVQLVKHEGVAEVDELVKKLLSDDDFGLGPRSCDGNRLLPLD